jgi:dUTP pyrophosphatase
MENSKLNQYAGKASVERVQEGFNAIRDRLEKLENPVIDINIEYCHEDAKMPTNAEGDLGWDICCVFCEDEYINEAPDKLKPLLAKFLNEESGLEFTLEPGERAVFRTGIKFGFPDGYGMKLHDRSGMSTINGVHVLAGLIDPSYRGELLVCLTNLDSNFLRIKEGDRIIQGVIHKKIDALIVKGNINKTKRGDKGFGSTEE